MKIDNASILLTGGTGSFGQKFVEHVLGHYQPKRILIYSRDEYKQYQMQYALKHHGSRLQFFIGDVRELSRLHRALEGIDVIVHAAALKHVPVMEENPSEAVRTNILGAENIIEAALDRGVAKVVALSTDKAVNPANVYGATKLVSDKLFVAANLSTSTQKTRFSVVRYGNVAGSRGSIIPFFKRLISDGARELPITDPRMTRFWISMEQAVQLVIKAITESLGGEVYVSKIPSFKITDLAQAMLPEGKIREIGIRPGEKLHEVMITEVDSYNTYEYDSEYIIYPYADWWAATEYLKAGGQKVSDSFSYVSDQNQNWLNVEQLRLLLQSVDCVY